ncbi:RBBP9/YdeN family alpha/beta hydrolase [Planktotalea sp.]|uniref:RBBP9/YdeN family alpha/beta hydrolase n=1 Tax=Planktotalea sp. TaxID=2029877 RepID=UPI003D6A1480
MFVDCIIIHGSFGSPYQNWAPWLYRQLTEQGQKVLVPHFTADEMQNLSTWTEIMSGYSSLIGPKTNVVAHSLGPAFVVDWFAKTGVKANHFVAVAPFYGLIDIPEFDAVNRTFFADKKLIDAAARRFSKVTCIYSDNDPYVPIELSNEFSLRIGASVEVIPGGAHLNSSAGFDEFPLLLEMLG